MQFFNMSFIKSNILAFTATLIILLNTSVACSSKSDPSLIVFAAASLSKALDEIGANFMSDNGTKIYFNYGGSQTLARQITRGAPADIFISAGSPPIQTLSNLSLLEGTPANILSNKLVVTTHKNAPPLHSVEDLKSDQVKRIAIADPHLAPVGQYAKESLQNLGLWKELQPKIILAPDAPTTINYLRTGNVTVAIIYQTDTLITDGTVALDIIPSGTYTAITYLSTVINNSDKKQLATEFLNFLTTLDTTLTFEKYGFTPIGSTDYKKGYH